MSPQGKTAQQPGENGGVLAIAWKHRLWWMLPLGVLLLLLGAIYALEHLSKTDSEMYPTSSSIQRNATNPG
jgi:hypothetical protein